MTSPLPTSAPELTRAATNRENAQHSTGPRTVEGKERVRLNAVKHGMYSQTVLIPTEHQAAFEQDRTVLQARYRPETIEEHEFVQTILECRWRLSQAFNTELNLQRLAEEQQLASIDELFGEQDETVRRALAQAAGFQANARIFDQIRRHQARMQRTIDRSASELYLLISARLERARASEALKPRAVHATEQSHPDASESAPHAPQMPEFTGSLKEFKRKQWLRQQQKLNNSPNAA